jgi:hypothetical protein
MFASFVNTRGLIMAETTKLSVGKALDKLRGKDDTKSKVTGRNERIDALNEETKRLRAARQRLERDQGGGSTGR